MWAFETGRGSRKMEYLKLITEKNWLIVLHDFWKGLHHYNLGIVFLNRDKGVPEFCVDSVMNRKILSHCINDPFRLVFPITAVFLMASWWSTCYSVVASGDIMEIFSNRFPFANLLKLHLINHYRQNSQR